VATGNAGCILQLRAALGDASGVMHPIELVDRAYTGV
jgi:Fe-S oxidoreductase